MLEAISKIYISMYSMCRNVS